MDSCETLIAQLPNEYLKKSIFNVIKQQQFIKYNVEIQPGSKKGDNYIGDCTRVVVTGIKENGKDGKLNLFCKLPKENEIMRQEFKVNEMFAREKLMYDEIIPEFKKIERERGVIDGFQSYANCLGTKAVNLDEFLLMGDLSNEGFVMLPRMAEIDLAHALLVMKELGKFHALSMALKDQKPEILSKFDKKLPELIFAEPFEGGMKQLIDAWLNRAINAMEFEGIYKQKWDYFCKNIYKIMSDTTKPELAEPYSIITHGDFWANNMLFKYENGEPVEIRFVDFQISRYASPILDIWKFMVINTDKPFRDLHYQTVIDAYYAAYSNSLTNLGSDPEKLFPYSAFQDQLKKFSVSGLGQALFLPMALATSDDVQDIFEIIQESRDISNEKIRQLCNRRFADVLIDLVDYGYL